MQNTELSREEHTPAYLVVARDVARRMGTSLESGLTNEEVAERYKLHGWNEMDQREHGIAMIVVRRAASVLTALMVAAAVLSIIFGHVADAIIISSAVLFDIIFGVLYESYSRYKIELIKRQVPRIADVIREGRSAVVPVRELVPGDLCVLRRGERVPADMRLSSVQGLRVDQSVLTGEPGDVSKVATALHTEAAVGDQRNMVFAGTVVTTGSARGIVVATGAQSAIGMLARRVVEAGTQQTPLERRLRVLGSMLGVGLIVISALLFVAGVFRGEMPQDMFRQAITLVVSAIPEDLTLMLTIALAVGARRLLTRHAVVRRLTAAETLGDATILCADKTGTLTTGQISLARVESPAVVWAIRGARTHLPGGTDARLGEIMAAALAGTEAIADDGTVSPRGPALERAIASGGAVLGLPLGAIRRARPMIDSIAFHPANRYRASLHHDPVRAEPNLTAVGAPDVLIPLAVAVSHAGKSQRLTSAVKSQLLERAAELAREGRHVLAVTTRVLPRETRAITTGDVTRLTFLALLVFDDPLRPDAPEAVASLQRAGVRVLLLTGDHRGTAETVAREVGILREGWQVLEGATVAGMEHRLLAAELARVAVVARVDPLQKERIVQVLQQQGEIVGMVGDGVNDAVALRRADLGVAVGSATDVAKDASDLVLLDQSIATLEAAVHEGRRVRETVRTVLSFLFSTNVTEVLALIAALVLHLPLPFLPAMLLWINIVTDGTADVALALEPAATRPGDPAPGRRRGVFRVSDFGAIVFAALAIFVPTMIVYTLTLKATAGDLAVSRTVAFLTLASAQLFSAYSFRSLDRPVHTLNPLGNLWLLGAILFSFALLLEAVTVPVLRDLLGTVPLTPAQWGMTALAALIGALGVEARKVFFPTTRQRTAAEAEPTRRPGTPLRLLHRPD